MGNALVLLIQMHNQAKGPVEELVSALEALVQILFIKYILLNIKIYHLIKLKKFKIEDIHGDIEYINDYERQFVADMN